MKQNMVEYLRKKYPKGTKIHIEIMEGEPQYANKDGIVEYVDDAGQIHGTWGGCALLEETDTFTVLERPKEKAYRATNIQWDVDEKEDLEELPDSMDIPQGMDEDEIDDYLSDQTGFCHDGFELEER